jgi:hypothetical protein
VNIRIYMIRTFIISMCYSLIETAGFPEDNCINGANCYYHLSDYTVQNHEMVMYYQF